MKAKSPPRSPYPRMHTLRYMGSKLALVDIIAPIVHEYAAGRGVVDLMAGTHAIGYALKPHARVWANDVQHYSQVIGQALLGPCKLAPGQLVHQLAREYLARQRKGFFEEVYSNTYFSPEQCRDIDAIRTAIMALDPPVQPLCLTALMAAMSYCQSTPGHFAQFLPREHRRVQALRRLRLLDVFRHKIEELEEGLVEGKGENTISGVAAEEFSIPQAAGVGYLDPPYTGDQYSRFYHLLETVVLNDSPAVKHKARYRQDRFRSNFCYPSRVEEAFLRILSVWAKADLPLVISYSVRGLLPLDRLHSLARSHYHRVRQRNIDRRHSSMGKGEKPVREVVIIASQSRLQSRLNTNR